MPLSGQGVGYAGALPFIDFSSSGFLVVRAVVALFVRPLVETLVLHCSLNPGLEEFGTLFLLAYVFLLRVPSEALPAVKSDAGMIPGAQSTLYLSGDELCLRLLRRKNKRSGSLLCRKCWCGESAITCPIHSLWSRVEKLPQGSPLFAGVTPARALRVLRDALAALQVADYMEFGTHGFRRGHTEDLRRSGASLKTILAAAEWRSPAFLAYLDLVSLETDFVVQAHADESDDELE